MKKIALSFLAVFSLNSFANNMVGINYNSFDTLDGFGLSLSGNGDSLVYDIDIVNLENDFGGSATFNFVHLGYAIGEISDGSFYIGVGTADSNVSGGDRISGAEVGYVLRDNGGIQYKVGVLTGDFEETIDFEAQIPAGGGNVELGVLHDDGDSWVTVGYSFNF